MRIPPDAVKLALGSIADWLKTGMCVKCAILATSAQLMLDYEALEELYIQNEVSKLPGDDDGN